ncbi:hypothetical protein LEP1GSC132_0721 [Leptospira kirschneri str. 200803703]|uniref:Uncharacterized protein n=1 Tax=Leptospira kirschneri str. 200802841 TaxID=1193047 RepID=A0A828Y0L5_9LEPT|nr:hypothetical protein [Leptospira kirschneri]EKO50450.1 hypothetical protein LEP1GSC131_1098 [Leptospira kirschneri str. 200802841]EMO65947.1 hypothetical protein LEP1GSC132_0721 [Leptospira kirschneri str. 200803703]EMO75157.1 hypothetical protein LEP1GSC127_1626 [Leptospira kirschneri str. 200801925]
MGLCRNLIVIFKFYRSFFKEKTLQNSGLTNILSVGTTATPGFYSKNSELVGTTAKFVLLHRKKCGNYYN